MRILLRLSIFIVLFAILMITPFIANAAENNTSFGVSVQVINKSGCVDKPQKSGECAKRFIAKRAAQ